MSGGEQGADSEEPERHTCTHTNTHTCTIQWCNKDFFLFYGYLSHRLSILINVSVHKQQEMVINLLTLHLIISS